MVDVLDYCCRNLPSDWQVEFHCREGEMDVEVINPDGDNISNIFLFDDVDFEDQVIIIVDYCRREDGLSLINDLAPCYAHCDLDSYTGKDSDEY